MGAPTFGRWLCRRPLILLGLRNNSHVAIVKRSTIAHFDESKYKTRNISVSRETPTSARIIGGARSHVKREGSTVLDAGS